MRNEEFLKLGLRSGPSVHLARTLIGKAVANGFDSSEIGARMAALVADPGAHRDDPYFSELVENLLVNRCADGSYGYTPRAVPAPWRQWGDDLDPSAVRQMVNACSLPVSVSGALMPDAHVGYGLPIGGVLATDNCVIPYAVGVDIACRMRLSVLDMPVDSDRAQLTRVLEGETRFGMGSEFKHAREHDVLSADWNVTPTTARLRAKAIHQLGTSGSGNHFVEFGPITFDHDDLGVKAGTYLAILSHSGSRGAGAKVADHYCKLARMLHPELPQELSHLAWLSLDSAEGQEYWAAMELMGQYAAANHEVIHREIVRALGARALTHVENHHNFAWKETHGGREVIVHRKGATPAGAGVLGVIPGSMASPAYVVRGKGSEPSLLSASHGAGRVMSRTQAYKNLDWDSARKLLSDRGVTLLSSGLDEVPMVYKDIDVVMAAQTDLVEKVARFFPSLVKMAPAGERPED
jgi:tRNA-splicing ligase RtcB